MKVLIAFVLFATTTTVLCEKVSYDNYQVWSLKIDTIEQLDLLHNLQYTQNDLSFWKTPDHLNQIVEVLVPPNMVKDFKELINLHEFKNKVFSENLQELIDNEQPKIKGAKFAWDRYRNVDEIYEWMDELIAENPEVCTSITMGYSYEGRPIKGIKVDHGLNAEDTAIFIEANIHAREWIAVESTLWMLDHLVRHNGGGPNFLKRFTWYVFPTVNPDGLHYTHTTDRMWRKTRSRHAGDSCYGTDGNRNFHYSWNMGGSSNNSCSETYMGPEPYSEVETRAIADFFAVISSKVELYLSFHSYSQLLMYPFGHSTERLENQADVESIAVEAANGLQQMFGTEYAVGNAQEILYTTSGGSRDWAKGFHKVPLSFTYEMRDTGRYGFLLPADQIEDNAHEIFHSLMGLIREGERLGYFKFTPVEQK